MLSYFGMEHPNTDAKVERFSVCYECVYKFPGGLLSANLDLTCGHFIFSL